MARTHAQVIAEMDVVQASLPELATLDTTSSTGFFPYLKNLFALLVVALDSLYDQLTTDLRTTLDQKQVGSLAWFVDQAKAYQYGVPTQLIGGRVGYTTVDKSKLLIRQAAAIEEGGKLVLKAVKQGGGGLIPLDPSELAAFGEYVGQVKYAGVQVQILSLHPEELGLEINVTIDRQVLAPNGSLLSNANRFPVLEALTTYLEQLPFNSTLSWTRLTDYMQTQPGILDFVIVQARSRVGQLNDPANGLQWTPFTGSYVSRAGHMRFLAAESTVRYL